MAKVRYAIITPVYNEEENIHQFLGGIVRQTISPSFHFMVNDASTDKTPTYIEWWYHSAPWLILLNRIPKKRSIASHVEAMNFGLQELLKEKDWDYVAIVDADVRLERQYFEKMLTTMKNNKFDLASGTIRGEIADEIRGCGRIYSRWLIEKMIKFPEIPGWDTFHTRVVRSHFLLPLLSYHAQMFPLRPSYKTWRGAYRTGIECMILRYYFLYLIGRCVTFGIRGIILFFTYLLMLPLRVRYPVSKQFKQQMQEDQRWKISRQVKYRL
jgi:glycosyltransferase involved in cell wall biosynthesis